MKRREFLKGAGAGLGLGVSAVAAPAVAQSMPEVKWRLTSSFPKSLDTLWGASETFARYCAEATDNRFQVTPFAAGEVVPGLQAFDAVSNGSIEACHTASYYFVGKDPTFALFTAVPFGLNTRQMEAWLSEGDGDKLMNEFTGSFNVTCVSGGNTGGQMGGWFRKEIKEVADLSGLKMRIAGMAGQVISKLGVVTQQLAGGDIYPALEKGTIDAAEWVAPYDDEKLGFHKVAQYYYYPGWWEGSAALHFMFSAAKWQELPKAYRAIATTAARFAGAQMTARYDARNPQALRRLVAGGAQLRAFSPAILEASLKAANDIYADIGSKNETFKKVFDSMAAFRNDQYFWWQFAEYGFDTFMVRTRGRI